MEIDLEGLREVLWDDEDGNPKDIITQNQQDKVRWIDTSTMICDPLTKAGNEKFCSRLVDTLKTGMLDLIPTVESTMKKMAQSKARQAKTEAKLSQNETEKVQYAYLSTYGLQDLMRRKALSLS